MSPEMLVRITARNDAKPAFAQVAADAKASSAAVVESGARAAVAAEAEALAVRHAGESAGLAVGSKMALAHATRSMIEQMAMGVSPVQALTVQFAHLSSVASMEGGVGGALRGIGAMLAPMAPALIGVGVAVGAGALAFAGLTTKINETAKTHVNFGQVFMATMQLAAESIGKFFQPAIAQLGKWWQQFVDWIAPIFKNVANGIIGSFVFAFNAVKDTWALLPAALGDLAIQATNNVIATGQNMINGVVDQVNNLLQSLKGVGISLGSVGHIDFGKGIANPFAGAASKVGGVLGADAKSAFGTDYAGAAFSAISQRSQALALADAAKNADKLGTSLKAANDNGKALNQMLSEMSPLLGATNDPMVRLQSDMDKLGALLNAGKISWDQYGRAVQAANLNAASSVLGSVGQITSTLAGAFQKNKALAVANALINTAEGVTKALAQGGMFAWPTAIAIGVAGAAQVASILSTSPGSGSAASVGSAPSSAGIGSASPRGSSGGGTASGPALTIQIIGKNFTADQVRDLMETAADVMADGGGRRMINVIKAAA